MIVYTYTEDQEHFSTLLKRDATEGEVKFRDSNGQLFVIRSEPLAKTSPFDVPSVSVSLTKQEILQSIHTSRERF